MVIPLAQMRDREYRLDVHGVVTVTAGGRPQTRAVVLSLLAEHGALSRADLVRRSALAFSTISTAVSDLQADGLVNEGRASTGQDRRTGVGRPSTLLSIDRRAGLVAGIDFGKRHIQVALADLAHNFIGERRDEIEEDLSADESTRHATRVLDDLLAGAGATRGEILGVGVGLPAPIQRSSGQVGDSSILPGWVGVHAAATLADALGTPVVVDNDANLGALSEWLWGAGQRAANMVYVKVATGIGAGLIINHTPYGGSGGTAGELGHTTIDPAGALCRCGNRGCLEVVAGTRAILDAARPASGVSSLSDVIDAALAGDTGCGRIIADAGDLVGHALGSAVNLLNPERIVVGDEISRAGEILLDPMRRAIERTAVNSAVHEAELTIGAFGSRAVVLGAAGLVLRTAAPRLS